MRLKSYTAATMAEAMSLVRRELGDDAIIVSTQRAATGKGVRITAALEQLKIENEFHLYDAGHAFQDYSRPKHYVKAASDDAWEKTFDFLRRNLR